MGGGESGTTLDEALAALADPYRRRILVSLLNGSSKVDQIANGGNRPDRFEILMHHVHLPRLEDGGFVRRDDGTREIVHGPRFEELRPLLELLESNDDAIPGEWP
jgi:hypothetical protein